MLALNKTLQKAGIEANVWFNQVQYAPLRFILAFFIEKADATMLLPQQSNLLIQAVKIVDDAVVKIEVLKE